MKIQQLDQLQSFTNVTSHVRNDLVFEHRFKEYGAYQIRKDYASTVLWALLFVFGGISVSIVVPKLFFNTTETEIVPPVITEPPVIVFEKEIDLTPKLDIPVEKIDPPKTDIMKTEKFTANVDVVDQKVTTEIKTQDVLQTVILSNQTQDGKIDDGTETIETKTAGDITDLGTINKPYFGVQEMPIFIGGEAAMFKFLNENINYPAASKEMGIKGTVYVQFVVAPDGSVQKAIIARGVKGGKELEAEALRVVKNMPKWVPGKQNGVPVFVQFTLPVNFVLR
ncbi:MAG: TonB family protein [Bacteroidota bacterium]